MNPIIAPPDPTEAVRRALAEDIGSGDITASLVDADARAHATLIVRESAVLCGATWFEETFHQLDSAAVLRWRYADGADLPADSIVCEIEGTARALLAGERTALNFLQTLSGTATATRAYVEAVRGTGARILDTRKTLPGLRLAQKYAVRCGGGTNHRVGLFDAILVKENHIAAANGIEAAVAAARATERGVMIEVEVETLEELEQALDAGADRLLLDNFSLAAMRAAVKLRAQRSSSTELEASGGITLEDVRAIAETGVDFISIGAITKHLRAIDYSIRFVPA